MSKHCSRHRDPRAQAALEELRQRALAEAEGHGQGRIHPMVRYAKQRFTGIKLMGSARKNSRSSGLSSSPGAGGARFVLCVRNRHYPASLELRKVYRLLSDEQASRRHQVRVIDESGEDYLYPEEYFVPIKLPQAAERAVLKGI